MIAHLPRFVPNLVGLIKATRFVHSVKHRSISYSAPLYRNFEDVIGSRQSEASRSIVVQVASEKSFDDVHQYCSQFGHVTKAYFYTVPKDTSFILLEYDNKDSVSEAFQSSAFPELASGVVPVKSSFMWFRNTPNKRKLKQIKDRVPLNVHEESVERKTGKLAKILRESNSISEQITLLYENTRLNDLSVRLRFLGALQIQRALSGLFLNHVVLPFGSTVNGFGKLGCDLDMILHYNSDDCSYKSPSDYSNRRLMFHTKSCSSDSEAAKRGLIENHIKFYGTLCESFIPGAANVTPIYKARVPIVRYFHKYLDISVDISLINMTGFYISELFHIFGETDERVRPLVFLVRRWAQEMQLTSKTNTHSFTNFQITCLVLSFLQQLPDPIIPTVPELVSAARKEDVRYSDEGRGYTFLRDMDKIQFKTQNTSSLEELFVQFLEFYGTFDFTKNLVSLTSKKPIRKIEPSALQIANPFEMEQNWSRNISSEECAAFKMHAQDTFADIMEIGSTTKPNQDRWGLLSIFPQLR
ncbi:poly(A) RNA polymerase, mitochondrial-like isoform X2 [Sitodiplosis mosellana]|uniref:poly(A) RNA polymerase, mitochondrial-like isoform X2 n=1 Tax=Sitodiplosis mosellana TaxID=263140 RepID=UPI0024440528|nr:poly(A) RNA polymerase, mitochondrial-like isoform X2 [Sitodiplosis mosellana]